MKIIVIGGGVGGLAAAWELIQAGHQVVLYESSPTLGGQVRTFLVGGQRVEIFYHHLFRSDTEIIRLIEELGLGADLDWIESSIGFQVGNNRYPFVTPMDLLKFRVVSLLTRLRLGFAALWLRYVTNWHKYEGQKAHDWIISCVGREGYDAVWGPLLRAKFGRHADEISMVWFWGKIHLRFSSRTGGPFARERLGYLRGSFGRLMDALADAIRKAGGQLETSSSIKQVIVQDGKVHAVEVEDNGNSRLEYCDAVIATIPSSIFTNIAPDLDPDYKTLLGAVEYQWATVLLLALDRALSDTYWLTMTDPECPFVVAVEQTNFVNADEYGGVHLVYFSNYCDPGDPVVEENVDETLNRYLSYIRQINPEFDPSWIQDKWLFKDRAGQPIVHSNYHQTIPPHRTSVPGLYLANTTQIYPEDRGQNYSIRLGQRVARLVMAEGPESVERPAREADNER